MSVVKKAFEVRIVLIEVLQLCLAVLLVVEKFTFIDEL